MIQVKKKILAAVDGSEGALNAVVYAGGLLAPGSCEVVLFHVMPPAPPLYREATDPTLRQAGIAWGRKQERQAIEIIEAAVATALRAGFLPGDVSGKRPPAAIGVARDILVEAARGDYDAVVMGRRGLGMMEDLFIGSVSHKVLQHTHLPLWLVEGRHLPLPILVGLDAGSSSLRTIDHLGFILGGATHVPVTLFHVQPPALLAPALEPERCEGAEAEREFPFLAEAKRELIEACLPADMIHISACARGRDPARELLREAHEGGYGTVVMGRRGLTGARAFFLGSVSSKLVSSARQMAVWVVP